MEHNNHSKKSLEESLGKIEIQPPAHLQESIRTKLAEGGLLKKQTPPRRLWWIIVPLALLFMAGGTWFYFSSNEKEKTKLKQDTIADSNEQKNNLTAAVVSDEEKNQSEKNSGEKSQIKFSIPQPDYSLNDAGPETFNLFNSTPGNPGSSSEDFLSGTKGQEPYWKEQLTRNGIDAGKNKIANDTAIVLHQQIISERVIVPSKPDSITKRKLPVDSSATPPKTPPPAKKKSFFLDAGAGPLWTLARTYHSTDAADANGKLFRDAETEKTSFGGMLNLTCRIGQTLLSAGVAYEKFKSEINFTEVTVQFDTTQYYTYIDSMVIDTMIPPDTFYIHVDSSLVFDIDSTNNPISKQYTNSFSVVEIPLMIGRSFQKGKFELDLAAGIGVVFITQVDAMLISPATHRTVNYSSPGESPFRKTGLNLIGSAALIYELNKRLSLFLRPAFQYGITNLYKKEYGLSEHIFKLHTAAGVRIKF